MEDEKLRIAAAEKAAYEKKKADAEAKMAAMNEGHCELEMFEKERYNILEVEKVVVKHEEKSHNKSVVLKEEKTFKIKMH